MKRTPTPGIVLALALMLVVTTCQAVWAAESSLDNFETVNRYSQGKFSDAEGKWYSDSVKEVYEKGIISGMSDRSFQPDGKLRISEAITLAAKIHDIYSNGENTIEDDGDTWYEPYINYAIENGIIEEGEFDSSITKYATRAEMAHILANSLPKDEFATKDGNVVETIPDVSESHRYADDIYAFYRSGILAGSGSDGSFTPNSDITRGETAAIITRIINVDERIAVNITESQTSATGNNSSEDYTITWTDKVTEQLARGIVGKNAGEDIKRSELDHVTSLKIYYGSSADCNGISVSFRGVSGNDFVKDVADFAHFQNLEELSFSYTKGTSFANMPSLSKLTSLQIYISSDLSGFSGLGKLTNLKSLNIYSADADDFAFLANLVNLEELDVARTGITDLTPIAGLTNLKVLKIYGNECDASVIAHLTGLQEVTVSNQVKNKEVLQFVPGYSNFNVSVNMGGA